jgi:branched-subunit amino acid transport protein
VAPELVLASGSLNVAPGNVRLVAAAVAVLVAWRTRNTLACLAAGMLALRALRFIAHDMSKGRGTLSARG